MSHTGTSRIVIGSTGATIWLSIDPGKMERLTLLALPSSQLVCLGGSQFPVPEARLAGLAGPSYVRTPCGCREIQLLADRLILIHLGSAQGVLNEVARRERHFLLSSNHPERANAAQAPAPLRANLRLVRFVVTPVSRHLVRLPLLPAPEAGAPHFQVHDCRQRLSRIRKPRDFFHKAQCPCYRRSKRYSTEAHPLGKASGGTSSSRPYLQTILRK
jgi:hypothetical protein